MLSSLYERDYRISHSKKCYIKCISPIAEKVLVNQRVKIFAITSNSFGT